MPHERPVPRLFAAVLCITPSVLFLGLWHGLKRLQNGDLVARVADHHGATVEDLVPGTRSPSVERRRAHKSDSTERHGLNHIVADGTTNETEPGRVLTVDRDRL